MSTCALPGCEKTFSTEFPHNGKKYCCYEHQQTHNVMRRPSRAKPINCKVCGDLIPLEEIRIHRGLKYCRKPGCQAEKNRRWNTARGTKKYEKNLRAMFGKPAWCRCPMCGRKHKLSIFYTGPAEFPPYYCQTCVRTTDEVGEMHEVVVW